MKSCARADSVGLERILKDRDGLLEWRVGEAERREEREGEFVYGCGCGWVSGGVCVCLRASLRACLGVPLRECSNEHLKGRDSLLEGVLGRLHEGKKERESLCMGVGVGG